MTPPDILAAIVAYLQQAMAESLNVTTANFSVWSDYAPDVPYPYAVVMDGPETYSFQSNDPELSGYYTHVIADGVATVTFVATSKAQVRALARLCIRIMADTVEPLPTADGGTLEFRPAQAFSTPVTDTGAGTPTVFRRTLTFHYKQEYPV